jgi:predicted extracellular nuclease
VQNASDVDCSQLPQLKTNDAVSGVGGPLTYHFDQYKIVLQEAESVTVETAELPPLAVLATLAPEQYRIATLNLEDYLTSAVEEDADAERPSAVDLARKQEKLSYLIGHTLDCPTLLGVQEVESLPLLQELAALLVAPCGFSYQISHRDSVDGRGIDVALLTDPRRVTVTAVTLRQTCTSLETGVLDPAIDCPAEEAPLFSRPPLEVSLLVDNKPLTLWVTHFKSKRGGAVETAARRLEQAEYVHELAASALTADAQAQLLVLGDINDYDESPTWRALVAEDVLIDVLQELPEAERYSYIFDGMAQLIDGMFVSPSLREQVAEAAIIHVNADFPAGLASDVSAMGIAYRASDHDAPILVIGRLPEPTLTPEPSPLPVPNLILPSPMPTTTVEVRIAAALSTSASATAVPVAPAAAVSKVDGEDGRLWPIAPLLALALAFGGLAWLALRRRFS